MAYQDMLTTFQAILNRDDVSLAQADVFVQQGINKLQREVRLPCMEREYDTLVSGVTNTFIIPNDLLAITDVIYTAATAVTPRVLDKTSYRKLVVLPATLYPFTYARIRGNIVIAGAASPGDLVRVLYYGAFGPIANFTSDNEVTLGFPDVAIYAGLIFAAASLSHPSKGDWEKTYMDLRQALMDEAIELETSGGPQAVLPMYWEP